VSLERPWYKVWPEDVPKHIEYPERPIYEMIDEKLKERPDKCVVFQAETGTCYTGECLFKVSKAVAAWLQTEGVNKGDQVLFSGFNTVEALAGLLGIWRAGAQAVLVDPLTTREDLEFQLEGRNIRVAVLSPEFYEREYDVLSKVGIEKALLLGHQVKEFEKPEVVPLGKIRSMYPSWREPNIRPKDDIGVVLYYSGIAGRTMQTLHTYFSILSSTIAYHAMVNIKEPLKSLVVAPLTHILGLQAGVLVALLSGGLVAFMKRWDPELALEVLASRNINYLSGAPLMHESLLQKVGQSKLALNLKIGVSGGAPLKPEVQELFKKVFNAPLVQLYGMTETWVITFQPINIAEIKATVGIPLPDVDVRIVDPENPRKELNVGEVGELLVKAPWIMKGYEDESENRKVFIDGWLRTGDLLLMDENGILYFKGVKKRMLKYKAYPIFPRDLEIILERHPAVEKAVVYGEPDPNVGQKPVAKVVLKKEYRGKIDPEEIRKYVNSRVAFYKKVHKVYIVDEI
jgi:long-chain acyl-CoA synthetase